MQKNKKNKTEISTGNYTCPILSAKNKNRAINHFTLKLGDKEIGQCCIFICISIHLV